MITENNAALVKAFTAARARLTPSRYGERGKHEFICNCIGTAVFAGEITDEEGDNAIKLIMGRLDGERTLVNWLINKSGAVSDRDRTHDFVENGNKKAQATRLAWLNSLIVEFGGVA